MPLDSAPVFDSITRVTDAAGNPISGATLEFYVAGTNTPKTVYADADLTVPLGTTVTTNSGGYPVTGGNVQTMIWVGTDPYKIVVKDGSGSIIVTQDNVRGAPSIPSTSATATPVMPVVAVSANYVATTADRGKLIRLLTTGGSRTLTLLSAVSAGDGFVIGVQHAGFANQAAVVPIAGQTISRSGKQYTSLPMTGYGETAWFVSDGANWTEYAYTPPVMPGRAAYFEVVDRRIAPPTNPAPGSIYLINGTPTGAWVPSGVQDKQLVQADGNGGWIPYAPSSGWLAWVQAEELRYQFKAGQWQGESNVLSPTASKLKVAVYEHRTANGTNGGAATNNAWTRRPLGTGVRDSIGITLSNNELTLPVDTYLVIVEQRFYGVGAAGNGAGNVTGQSRLSPGASNPATMTLVNAIGLASDAGASASGSGLTFNATTGVVVRDTFILDVTVAGTVGIDYYCVGASNLGNPSAEPTNAEEIHARISLVSLSSLQGPQGIPGAQGPVGKTAGLALQWTTTTVGDPGAGKIGIDAVQVQSATLLRISKTDLNAASISAFVASWDDSTSVEKARIRATVQGVPGTVIEYRITGTGTDQGTYWTFPATFVQLVDPTLIFVNGVELAVNAFLLGDKGNTGESSYPFAWSTSTSGDPGSGNIGINAALPNNATALRVSKTDRGGATIAPGNWDDSTSSIRALVRIWKRDGLGSTIEYQIIGTGTDLGNYWSFPVSPIVYTANSGAFAAADLLELFVARTGDKGDTGAAGANATVTPNIGGLTPRTGVPAPTESMHGWDGSNQWLYDLNRIRGWPKRLVAGAPTATAGSADLNSVIMIDTYNGGTNPQQTITLTLQPCGANERGIIRVRRDGGSQDGSGHAGFGEVTDGSSFLVDIPRPGASADFEWDGVSWALVSDLQAIRRNQITVNRTIGSGYSGPKSYSAGLTGKDIGSELRCDLTPGGVDGDLLLSLPSASSGAVAGKLYVGSDCFVRMVGGGDYGRAVQVVPQQGESLDTVTQSNYPGYNQGILRLTDDNDVVWIKDDSSAFASLAARYASDYLSDQVAFNSDFALWPRARTATASANGVQFAPGWRVLTESGTVDISRLSQPWQVKGHRPRFGARLTQTQSSAQKFGVIQWLRAEEVQHLRNRSMMFTAHMRQDIANNTQVKMAVLAWSGTENQPPIDPVLNWSSGTYTAGSFFVSTSGFSVLQVGFHTLASTSTAEQLEHLWARLPTDANNIGIMIWTTIGVPQNGNVDFAGFDFVQGGVKRPRKPRLAIVEMPRVADRTPLICNGSFLTWQQATASTSRADRDWCADGWHALTQSNPVDGARATGPSGARYALSLTQANASAQRFGAVTVAESNSSVRRRGLPVCLIGRVYCSAAALLRYAILEWTGSADALGASGRDVVNDWTSSTYTVGNFFASTTLNLLATGSVSVAAAAWTDIMPLEATVGTGAANLIAVFWTSATQAQTTELRLAEVGLYGHEHVLSFTYLPESQELAQCQRRWCQTRAMGVTPADGLGVGPGSIRVINPATTEPVKQWHYPVPMLKSPTITRYNPRAGGTSAQWTDATNDSANARTLWTTESHTYIDNGGVGLTTTNWHIDLSADARP